MRIDSPAHVGVSRAGGRVERRHASVTDGGEQHRHAADEHRIDGVAKRQLLGHAEQRHHGDGLNEDHAVEHQVPEAEHAAQARHRGSCRRMGVDLNGR